ncbi:MAG: tRNA (adenosine(37)-N6)-dimethylallyltransferase MiaA [Rhodospirillaceae bacterium]|nr:tRNA (adenosine(37)-N6)-dimethylallyltransferase MiaA [Rhodospirillaceae bacterium]
MGATRPADKPDHALSQSRPVLVVAGPTVSGKSALAVALAERFGGTVINADSLQVYRELAILTARPGSSLVARAPHRLYGVLSAAEACSAARWRDMALAEIAASQQAGKLPIVTGGTGLYLESLLKGIAPVPEIPRELRERARSLLDVIGAPALHQKLAVRDPAMAARISANDGQRLTRAWEVLEATGRSLADFQQTVSAPGIAAIAIQLMPPREDLYAAADARFAAMMAQGALEEARGIRSLGLGPNLPAMKALGLKELIAHLDGEMSLDRAVALAQQATRNYAKRQLTWFRHRSPALAGDRGLVLNEQYSERLDAKIFSFICQFLLTDSLPKD